MTDFGYKQFTFTYEASKVSDILFMSISGSHATGWATDTSDLDLKIVYFPTLKEMLSIGGRLKVNQSYMNKIDVIQYPINHFLGLLANGNGNLLEALYQEKLILNKHLVDTIKRITECYIHRKFLNHYLGYSTCLLKDFTDQSKIIAYGRKKLLLMLYKTVVTGLILTNHKEMVFNILKQQEYYPNADILKVLEGVLKNTYISYSHILQTKKKIEFLWRLLRRNIKDTKEVKGSPLRLYETIIYDYYTKYSSVNDDNTFRRS